MSELKYKRVLLKLSGEVLAGKQKTGVDVETVGKICDKIKEIVEMGVQVARLVPQKAIDRLIKVHSKLIKENGKTHNFYIIGDGPDKERLVSLIKKYGVKDTFFLLGKKENPYPYIKKADYFCLLSEFEGYGMVLEEAKILNKPIIITDTAAREAIEKYENSKILENTEEGIYKGLKEIIQKPYRNKEFSSNYNNLNRLKDIIDFIGE